VYFLGVAWLAKRASTRERYHFDIFSMLDAAFAATWSCGESRLRRSRE
jgi:hypothetical protein